MSHSNTELLIDYWQNLVFDGRAPARSTINPADFPTLLPQVFILGRQAAGRYIFRLTGGLIRDLYGRDLRAADYAGLWVEDARLAVQTALERSRREIEPVRLRARGVAGDNVADFEIALLPISNDAGDIDRVLGLYQPLTPLIRLRGLVIDKLLLTGLDADDRIGRPHLRLAAIGGQRVG